MPDELCPICEKKSATGWIVTGAEIKVPICDDCKNRLAKQWSYPNLQVLQRVEAENRVNLASTRYRATWPTL
jgi:hypothetical protein